MKNTYSSKIRTVITQKKETYIILQFKIYNIFTDQSETIIYNKSNVKFLNKKYPYNLPVRIFWNAASTLVESSADVSIKDSSFLSEKTHLPVIPVNLWQKN